MFIPVFIERFVRVLYLNLPTVYSTNGQGYTRLFETSELKTNRVHRDHRLFGVGGGDGWWYRPRKCILHWSMTCVTDKIMGHTYRDDFTMVWVDIQPTGIPKVMTCRVRILYTVVLTRVFKMYPAIV